MHRAVTCAWASLEWSWPCKLSFYKNTASCCGLQQANGFAGRDTVATISRAHEYPKFHTYAPWFMSMGPPSFTASPQTRVFWLKAVTKGRKYDAKTTRRNSRTLITAKWSARSRESDNSPESVKDGSWTPEKLGFLEIGEIRGPHGVHGEMKVLYSSDFPRRRLSSSKGQRYLLLPGRRYPRPIALRGGRKGSQMNTWIVKVEGIDEPETVRGLRGAKLFVKRDDRPGLAQGEFLVTDLVGLTVVLEDDPDGDPIGSISSVILRQDISSVTTATDSFLGSDILEVKEHSSHSGEDTDFFVSEPPSFLIPFVRELVPKVDIEMKTVMIRPPPGLIETTKVYRKPRAFVPRGLLSAAR